MKFNIDKDLCIICGACQSICDEIFTIEDDGYAVAKDVNVKDEEIKESAIEAMEGCPTNAISKKED